MFLSTSPLLYLIQFLPPVPVCWLIFNKLKKYNEPKNVCKCEFVHWVRSEFWIAVWLFFQVLSTEFVSFELMFVCWWMFWMLTFGLRYQFWIDVDLFCDILKVDSFDWMLVMSFGEGGWLGRESVNMQKVSNGIHLFENVVNVEMVGWDEFWINVCVLYILTVEFFFFSFFSLFVLFLFW